MALSDFPETVRVANTEGWYDRASILIGGPGVPPWTGVPAFVGGTGYDATSACTQAGALYVANPAASPASWTAASDFASDRDATGTTRWLLVDSASAWATQPYDLTGARLVFALQSCDGTGAITGTVPALRATSDGPELPILDPASGAYALAIPEERVATVPPGLYRFDIIATLPSGRRDRVRYGLWQVDAGVNLDG